MSNRKKQSVSRKNGDLNNLKALIGNNLLSIFNNQCFINGKPTLEDIDNIEIKCTNGVLVSIYLLSDGESVGSDFLPLEPDFSFEHENMIFRFARNDLSISLKLTHLIGKSIVNVQGIIDTYYNNYELLIGYKIIFDTSDYLVFYNGGDEGKLILNLLDLPNSTRLVNLP